MTPVLFMMGAGPLARWKRAELGELKTRLRWSALAGAAGAVVPVLRGGASPWTCLGLVLSAWLSVSVLVDVLDRARRAGQGSFLRGLARLPRGYYGMAFAHFGVAMFAFGVTVSGSYSSETDTRVTPGSSVELGGYSFRFDGVRAIEGPNYLADRGRVTVSHGGREVAVMEPEKRRYAVQERVMTEAAIDLAFSRHLYVALGEPLDGSAWSVRLYVKPAVQFIWSGVLCMVLGGILAGSDRRYRLRASATEGVQPGGLAATIGEPSA
jgi:cytochrome c-type biogenesis protein CcmF